MLKLPPIKFRFGILTLLLVTTGIAIFISSIDEYEETYPTSTVLTLNDRLVMISYLVRPHRWNRDNDRIEFALIQSVPDFEMPTVEYQFKGNEKTIVLAGDTTISLPTNHTFHEIWDGNYSKLQADSTRQKFLDFLERHKNEPRLSNLSKFLEP